MVALQVAEGKISRERMEIQRQLDRQDIGKPVFVSESERDEDDWVVVYSPNDYLKVDFN